MKKSIFKTRKGLKSIDDKIRNEKLQYEINRDAVKISELSSGKSDKYEYLTDEETFPFNHRQIIEQCKSTYSPLGKLFERQIKTVKGQGEKTNKGTWRAWETIN